MKLSVVCLAIAGLQLIAPTSGADPVVFFEENFAGPTLDSAVWRTEILTSGPRVCADTSAPWSPGHWVDEGADCHGVAAFSPYGSAVLGGGLLGMSSSNGRAFPVLLSRLPGSVQLFPTSGNFTLTVRMRYDRVTPWGDGVAVFQAQNTDPVGGTPAFGIPQNILLHLWADYPGGIEVNTALGGSIQMVASAAPATELHEFALACVGSDFTISVDGQVVYGPVSSALRPTAVVLGNAALAFWYPTDWSSFSVDYIRVEVPGLVSVAGTSWSAIKSLYRN